jgi:hypothetical protein
MGFTLSSMYSLGPEMQIACPLCAKTLEYTGEPPRFCAYCGQSLTIATEAPTIAPTRFDPDQTAPATGPAPVDVHVTAAVDASISGTVGGYRLMRRLGGGGMGAVYEAEETASGRRVALKLILPEIGGSGEALVRFRQEGRLASTLSHPRCVFVLAADQEAGRPYIVMELMPGTTLSDLVRQRGPLTPEEAIAKILDVIDGLAEAHRRGLVHRDVKPSNCFLEASGRVKIGDFGLARSLDIDAKLTRTGAFVGTPLYAAPEQIHKKDVTDAQSDVYSVAATLYFLLTTRAPFQSAADAMATMARIVTEDPPSMRTLRPELPRALDKVVLRGLERDRRRRYKDLAQLRRALLPFLPARPSVGGLGLRFGAYLIDYVVLVGISSTLGHGIHSLWHPANEYFELAYATLLQTVYSVGYFGIFEGRWGCALGKWLLRLRVGTPYGAQPPGIGRAMVREGVLHLTFNAGTIVVALLAGVTDFPKTTEAMDPDQQTIFTIVSTSVGLGMWAAIALTVSTMRRRNGYRGLHEFASGTRTYHLRWPAPEQRRSVRSRAFELETMQPAGLPGRVGPFLVRGALRWNERERTLVADDLQLDRTLWIWMRPATEPPLDAARRDINRTTRIRWVACGADGAWQWDAFLAPAGMPLPMLAAGPSRLDWGDVRPLLEDLAEELSASCADATLPRSLTTHQVWVHPDGRVQLLGTPLTGSSDQVTANLADGENRGGGDEERALAFLREVAVTALEGDSRPVDERGDRIHAPVPAHAAEVLDRLMGQGQPYRTFAELHQDLQALGDRPATVSRLRRAFHLALMMVLWQLPFGGVIWMVVAPFVIMFMDVSRDLEQQAEPQELTDFFVFMLLNCGFWIVWAFLFRGGFGFWCCGIALRRGDGRKAWRLQCALRALLVWTPIASMVGLAVVVADVLPALPWLYFSLWGVGVLLVLLYVPLALINPTRGPHDRIAGTYLVPS